MVTPADMLFPGRIYIALSSWQFGDFRNIFLPIIGEDQQNSYGAQQELLRPPGQGRPQGLLLCC